MAWLTRFVVMVSFLALGIVVSPETFGSKSTGQMGSSTAIGGNLAVALKLAHLLSFATAWGSALWVTFIGGIIMFRTLPRHQFGNLQGKMFPAYFSMVAVCGAVCLAAFGLMHPWSSASYLEKLQLGLLVSSLVFTLTNIFIFMPMTMDMMRQRHKIEREENIGNEVGLTKNHEVAKRNPKLAEVNKKFGMIHGLSSLANLLSFGGLAMHSWYLADRLLLAVAKAISISFNAPLSIGQEDVKAGLGDEWTKDLDLQTVASGGLGVEPSAVSRGSALPVLLVMVFATKHNFKALEAAQTFMAHTRLS